VRSTTIQAHRGSPDPASGVRENTVEAFVRARRLGADGIELDVRTTADGALAVHHDPLVEGAGPLSGLTAAELPSYIPLLADALDACRGLTVNIEIKNLPGEPGFDPDERVAREVVDLVVGAGRESGVVISSFWPPTLEAVHALRPDLVTGLLLAPWFDPGEAVAAAVARGFHAVHPHVDLVSGALVAGAHRAGLAVAAWPVNGAPAMAAVAEAGVDTVITDDVPLAVATLDGD
jgi:glycerophosphoryl diester phosphodiesterase